MRIIVRGYGDGKLVLEEHLEFNNPEELTADAIRQVETVTAYEIHMVEIEFLDETDPLQRFKRFGTDTNRMVWPQEIGGPAS